MNDEADEADESDDDDGGDDGLDAETEAVLIAGRAIETSELTRSGFDAFAAHVEDVGRRVGVALSVVGGGDLTRTGPGPTDTLYATIIVGVEIGRGGGDRPDEVSRDAALARLAEVRQVSDATWAEIAASLPGTEKERLEEAQVALHLTCTGPLAAGILAFGVTGTEDAGGPGTFLQGQDTQQEPHRTGVFGLQVGYCQYESPDAVEVDLEEGAHASHVAKVGVPEARYYLIARYD